MEEKTFTEDLCKTATGNKSVDVLLSSQNVLKLKTVFLSFFFVIKIYKVLPHFR